MMINWGYLFGMVLQTVPEPRKVARDVFAFSPPRNVLWQIIALILVSMAFMRVIGNILFPVDPADFGPLLANPMMVSVTESSVAVLTVFAVYWVGRALGGEGSFDEAMKTVIWLLFVDLNFQIAVLFLGLFAPALALLLGGMAVVMTFWILSHFITEMHGFRSAGMVFVGILFTMLGMVVVLSVVFAMIGVSMGLDPQGGML